MDWLTLYPGCFSSLSERAIAAIADTPLHPEPQEGQRAAQGALISGSGEGDMRLTMAYEGELHWAAFEPKKTYKYFGAIPRDTRQVRPDDRILIEFDSEGFRAFWAGLDTAEKETDAPHPPTIPMRLKLSMV